MILGGQKAKKVSWNKPHGVVIVVGRLDCADSGIGKYAFARSSFEKYRWPNVHVMKSSGSIVVEAHLYIATTIRVAQNDELTWGIMPSCFILFSDFKTLPLTIRQHSML